MNHRHLRPADLFQLYSHLPDIPSDQFNTRLDRGFEGVFALARMSNPLFAWVVYHESRSRKAPIPEFALAYLDRVAGRLRASLKAFLNHRAAAPSAAKVQEYLELKVQGRSGAGTAWSRARQRARQQATAVEFYRWQDSRPKRSGRESTAPSRTTQIGWFATVTKRKPSAVRKALERYPRELIESIPIVFP